MTWKTKRKTYAAHHEAHVDLEVTEMQKLFSSVSLVVASSESRVAVLHTHILVPYSIISIVSCKTSSVANRKPTAGALINVSRVVMSAEIDIFFSYILVSTNKWV